MKKLSYDEAQNELIELVKKCQKNFTDLAGKMISCAEEITEIDDQIIELIKKVQESMPYFSNFECESLTMLTGILVHYSDLHSKVLPPFTEVLQEETEFLKNFND